MPGAHAQNVDPDAGAPAGPIHLELPAQPLAQALQTYSRATNVAVIALDRELAGHLSAPVDGDYAPQEALQHLLAGTGFEAEFTGADAALVIPMTSASQPSPSQSPWKAIAASAIDGASGDEAYRTYAALIQTRLTEALCESPQTRPGTYRLVAQLRLDAAGSVVDSRVAGSTGLATRDAAIEQAMRAMTLDWAPPPGLPEPITILLHPDGNGVHTHCPQPDGDGNVHVRQ